MSFRRILPLILINVVVSAAVVLTILYWWDGRRPDDVEAAGAPAAAAMTPAALTAAEAVALSTDTPEPEDGPLVHTVQAGDTLGNISQFYNVSMDDIMNVNDITNPNLLSIGQQLVIPVGGLPATDPAPTEVATADVPAPIATEPLIQGEVVIDILEVIGVGQLADEAVQIVNTGSSPVALRDWQLVDQDGHVYTFGQVTLFGDGAGILVHTAAGRDDSTDLFWGLEQPIWRSGEVVTLRDAEGDARASFEIP